MILKTQKRQFFYLIYTSVAKKNPMAKIRTQIRSHWDVYVIAEIHQTCFVNSRFKNHLKNVFHSTVLPSL